jgi:uncharacterized protein (DUF433 family)
MTKRIVRETTGNEPYEYSPLGEYVVSARGVCRGRPTFKHTRIEVAGVLERLGAGHSVDELVENYRGRVSRQAIAEALALAGKALAKQASLRK